MAVRRRAPRTAISRRLQRRFRFYHANPLKRKIRGRGRYGAYRDAYMRAKLSMMERKRRKLTLRAKTKIMLGVRRSAQKRLGKPRPPRTLYASRRVMRKLY